MCERFLTLPATQGVENCGETPGQIVVELHAVAVTVVDKLHAVTGHPSYILSFSMCEKYCTLSYYTVLAPFIF